MTIDLDSVLPPRKLNYSSSSRSSHATCTYLNNTVGPSPPTTTSRGPLSYPTWLQLYASATHFVFSSARFKINVSRYYLVFIFYFMYISIQQLLWKTQKKKKGWACGNGNLIWKTNCLAYIFSFQFKYLYLI